MEDIVEPLFPVNEESNGQLREIDHQDEVDRWATSGTELTREEFDAAWATENQQGINGWVDAEEQGDIGQQDEAVGVDNTNDEAIVEEDDIEAAARDAAQEVANAAAAAEAARADAAIDEQTRWIRQLRIDNPEEFNSLVESGVIDEDFLDRVEQMDEDAIANNNNNQAAEDGTDEDQDVVQDPADAQADPANNQDAQDDAAQDNGGAPNPAPATIPRNDDHFVWLPNRNDAREENTTCPACFGEFDASDLTVFLNCGHKWCADCLNSNYRAALQNRNNFPPRCCDTALEHESVQNFLDEDLLIELITKLDEFNDPDPIYCQTPKCTGGYIPRLRIDGQWASCSECRKSTCVECKAPASDHPMPQMHPKMLAKLDEELAEKEGWKQCPGCKNIVERIEGCDFMTCQCGHAFCYRCGGTLMNNMPCVCQGTPGWVQQMNAEAAGVDGDGEDDNEDGEDDNEDGEDDNEDGEDDDEDGGHVPARTADGDLPGIGADVDTNAWTDGWGTGPAGEAGEADAAAGGSWGDDGARDEPGEGDGQENEDARDEDDGEVSEYYSEDEEDDFDERNEETVEQVAERGDILPNDTGDW